MFTGAQGGKQQNTCVASLFLNHLRFRAHKSAIARLFGSVRCASANPLLTTAAPSRDSPEFPRIPDLAQSSQLAAQLRLTAKTNPFEPNEVAPECAPIGPNVPECSIH